MVKYVYVLLTVMKLTVKQEKNLIQKTVTNIVAMMHTVNIHI
jgi:hypothetical protein